MNCISVCQQQVDIQLLKIPLQKYPKKQEILRDKYDEGLYTENYYTCGKKIKKT